MTSRLLPRLRFLLLAALLAVAPAFAVTVPDLYEVAMPVAASRDAAFVDALKVVVVRVSGRRDAAVRLGGALNNPRQYVQRFGFTADNVLQVGFDSVSVDKLLTDAGLPVWGRERPATLVLLNVQATDGSSYWIDSAASTVEREAISRAAKQRGLPIIWPEMTTQDRTQINAGVDASADPSALLQAAARYNANAALLGTARTDGAGGLSVRWTLASDDGAASAAGSLEEGVNLAADTFARVYSASGTTLDSVMVEVSGIGNLGAYATTLNYLEGMTLVRGVAVEQVLGDTLRFKLAIRGDATTLRRALALDGKLVPLAPADAAAPVDRLQFQYQP
ncbi:hypothetical protein HNQ60_000266 [Povalibacter uvarum]|uniref:DUF2066 domain-containing protein n=1 Tax=Povalibacter uvarum TaxID=732238 RepID=A0A841HGE4_9GAMM|nr:DUF2066 domain-containing protein [Povalibacter uvarum]MBB6091420.1 hypothetical protein [Povalibacter uvarum]